MNWLTRLRIESLERKLAAQRAKLKSLDEPKLLQSEVDWRMTRSYLAGSIAEIEMRIEQLRRKCL
jgi:hypothetical protein